MPFTVEREEREFRSKYAQNQDKKYLVVADELFKTLYKTIMLIKPIIMLIRMYILSAPPYVEMR